MRDVESGTSLMRQRVRRRRLIVAGQVAAGVAYVVVGQRFAGQGLPLAGLTALFYTVVALGGWLSWRDRDEVERREATIFFGATGLSLLFLFPALRAVQPVMRFHDPIAVLGIACLALGFVVCAGRRLIGVRRDLHG